MGRITFPCLETYSKLQWSKKHGMGLRITPGRKGWSWSEGMRSLQLLVKNRVEPHSRKGQCSQHTAKHTKSEAGAQPHTIIDKTIWQWSTAPDKRAETTKPSEENPNEKCHDLGFSNISYSSQQLHINKTKINVGDFIKIRGSMNQMTLLKYSTLYLRPESNIEHMEFTEATQNQNT